MKKNLSSFRRSRNAKGSAIIEAMISIVIFSVGMIGLMGMQASAIKQSGDAKLRADAAYMANQLVGTIWADRANIASYAYRANAALCTSGGTSPTYAPLVNWVNEVNSTLPRTSQYGSTVAIDTTTNTVTVTICWAQPTDSGPHSFVSTTQIN